MKREITKFKALIADQHLLFRRGLQTLLRSEGDFEVMEVSTASDVISALSTWKPEVIVMDAELLQADEQNSRTLRQMRGVLILTSLDADPAFQEAFKIGADGYMVKSVPPSQLIAKIRQIASRQGSSQQHETRSASDLNALASSGQRSIKPTDLTLREREVLKMLAEGRTVKDVASELDLSAKTVESHKLNLMRKLDIHNRSTLRLYAVKNGLVHAALTHQPETSFAI